MGNAAQEVLSGGVDFSTVTLAVTGQEGDPLPQLLEEQLVKMQDISRYCSVRAMDRSAAQEALEAGQVTAIVVLPPDFVEGILYGSNPDVTLIVDEDRPVEAILTLWLGQSATDLLSAVQSGVYAVLDAYDAAPAEGLSRDQVVLEINLRYINRTLSRQDFFRTLTVRSTGALDISTHYALSLLIWLFLSLSPLFYPIYTPQRLSSRRRLRSIGIPGAACCLSDLAACAAVLFPMALLSFAAALPGQLTAALLSALAVSLFCALFGSLCSLLTGSAARCGSLSFLISLAGLTLAGGILPPVMLPPTLQSISWLSPVTWLRSIPQVLLGHGLQEPCLTALAVAAVAMMLLVLGLYRRRMAYREVTQ